MARKWYLIFLGNISKCGTRTLFFKMHFCNFIQIWHVKNPSNGSSSTSPSYQLSRSNDNGRYWYAFNRRGKKSVFSFKSSIEYCNLVAKTVAHAPIRILHRLSPQDIFDLKNSLRNLVLCSIVKWSSSQIFFIFEHGHTSVTRKLLTHPFPSEKERFYSSTWDSIISR